MIESYFYLIQQKSCNFKTQLSDATLHCSLVSVSPTVTRNTMTKLSILSHFNSYIFTVHTINQLIKSSVFNENM
jgi:hypothetical protein